ncbi:MAG: carboxypeptidase M32 [Candidatus Dormibacteraeota bacterium]|nr:carboxypeptidase M32 [Candidatus Dormibacteraeota bacterium]
MATSALAALREALGEVCDLSHSAAVLSWDQETYMPSGGVAIRARQLSTLRRLAHDRLCSDELGRLLEGAEAEVAGWAFDSDEASLVRVVHRDRKLALRVPGELVAEIAREGALSRPVWLEARARSDWRLFAPRMQVTVDLSRRLADAYGYEARPYDALLGRSEPGLTTAEVEALFGELRAAVQDLLTRIAANSDRVDDSVLERELDPQRQLEFARDTIAGLGFDLDRGRQDLSAHPFCTAFGPGDVRLTTRVGPRLRDSCLFSSIHESGHGMYNQGLPARLDGTPLWAGASPGVHESQSRLWENLVGRSRPFWSYAFPRLQAEFPGALDGVDAEAFYRAVCRVRPSYIRVDADEVTYNLHIMLRFEIENALLEDRLRVDEVPEAWNAALARDLGLPPPREADGALQDIHWTSPVLGGFVGYTLGNVIGAQLMNSIRAEMPDLDGQLAAGEFFPLLGWLQRRVYVHGRKFTPGELVERVTGRPLTAAPWIDYVRAKFGDLYGLPEQT